uniref:mitogen-activated protein kinase kinase n=1 Tax=Culicoides sonorensis TaxID=179676 RepID=A0A336KTZ5_CULSO
MESRKDLKLPFGRRKTRHAESTEKFKNIMGRNKILIIDGKEWKSEREEMEDQGEIGYGTCGHVQKMIHLPTRTPMAVKQMRRTGNEEENKRIAMDLDVVLKSHDCPYIVRCFGCFILDAEVWICMELMSTCFDRLLKHTNNAGIPERILGKVTVATVKALSYLKDKHGVIHRDVKPSNILIDTLGNIKLCDFGISGRLVDSKAKTRSAGCAAYMSPERIDPKQGQYDIRADVWALGITLIELATGVLPYQSCKNEFEVLTMVLGSSPPRLPDNGGFTVQFNRFVNLCLTKDYNERPKYPELLEEPFIKFYIETRVDVDKWYESICKEYNIDYQREPTQRPKLSLPPSVPMKPLQVVNGSNNNSFQFPNTTQSDLVDFQLQFNTRKQSEFKFEPLSRTPNLSSRPDRSLSPPNSISTPPARRSRGLISGGLNKCICEIKNSVENLKDKTSPILLKRYCHQQSQLSFINGDSKTCPKCNGGRKALSANAATGPTYSNGFSPVPQRQFSHDSPHIPSRFREDNLPRHHRSTDTILNSYDSCDTTTNQLTTLTISSNSNTSTITNISSSNNSNHLAPFYTKEVVFASSSSSTTSPSINGNRVAIMTQQYQNQIKTTTTNPLRSPPPPLRPRRSHEPPPELPMPRNYPQYRNGTKRDPEPQQTTTTQGHENGTTNGTNGTFSLLGSFSNPFTNRNRKMS